MSLADIRQLLAGSGSWVAAIVLLAMTCIEIIPVKFNPWSWLAGLIGKAINKDVMNKLEQVEASQKQLETRLEQVETRLEKSDRVSADSAADSRRKSILKFNLELMRGLKHTREDFVEVLSDIDAYKEHCEEYPDYPNSRAVHAISNIERVYDELMKDGSFFEPEEK